MKFKNDIEAEAGFKDKDGQLGSAGQILSSTGTKTDWIDQGDIVAAGATRVLIACKNTSGATITKGTPVYQTGNVGATDVIEIAEADALISTGYLPAIGLLETDLIINAFGNVVITGELLNITTDPIDGVTPTVGDTIYLKSGGGLTLTKPTGEGNAIQNLGLIGKVSGGNAGSITVASIMRQNDVPNLTTGKIWVGDSNTVESTVVHLDETNNRLGVNQTSPIGAVHIVGPNTNPAMTTSALVVEQGDGAKILIDGNDIDAASGMLYLNDYSTNDVVFGGQIRVGGGGSPVGNSWFANGNVGIGTTSPGYKLDVSGTGRFTSTLYTNSSSTSSVGIIGKSQPNGWGARYDSNNANYSGFYFDNNNDSSMILRNDAGNVNIWLKSDSSSYFNGGNVGIGTTSPNAKLEVVGTGQFLSGSSGVQLYGTGGSGNINSLGTNDLIMMVNGSEKMRIRNSGNVGIGTTSPSVKLEVSGEIDVAGGDGYRIDTKPFANWSLDLLTLGDWDGEGYETRFMGSNSSEVMRVTDTKVGIGTTAPSQKLHVAGTGLFSSTLYLGDTNCALFRYFNSLVITSSGGTSITLGGGPGNINNNVFVGNGYLDVNGYIRGKNYLYLEDANGTLRTTLRSESTYTTLDNGSNVLNYNAGNHYFLVGLSEKMRINSSGNVGIGTTSPGEKLEVNGTVKAVDGYKGYVSHFHNCGFFHSPRSSDGGNPLWIPINSTATSSSDQYYNTWVPLYAGRVRKIILKHISGSTPVATVCTFRKKINGTLDSTTYSGTVTGGGAAGMKVTFDFGTTNFTFNAEDEVQIGVVTGLPTQPGMGGMSCQIWYEYNIT